MGLVLVTRTFWLKQGDGILQQALACALAYAHTGTHALAYAHTCTHAHTHAHALQAHLACSDYEGVVQIWDANANSEVRGRDGRGSHLTRAGERAGLKPHVIQLAQASEHMGVC